MKKMFDSAQRRAHLPANGAAVCGTWWSEMLCVFLLPITIQTGHEFFFVIVGMEEHYV